MTTIRGRRPLRRPSGFTLIEVLVTVVLISVGLLGIAALQLTTLRGNQESYVRSQANVLASDILDRIRANPLAFRNGAYDIDLNGAGGGTATRADQDLTAWQRAIDTLLPGGAVNAAGQIERATDATTLPRRHIVTITIQWSERPDGTGVVDPQDNGLRTFQTRSEI